MVFIYLLSLHLSCFNFLVFFIVDTIPDGHHSLRLCLAPSSPHHLSAGLHHSVVCIHGLWIYVLWLISSAHFKEVFKKRSFLYKPEFKKLSLVYLKWSKTLKIGTKQYDCRFLLWFYYVVLPIVNMCFLHILRKYISNLKIHSRWHVLPMSY